MKIGVIGTRGFPDIQGGLETHCLELYTRIAKNKDINITVYRRTPYLNDRNRVVTFPGIRFVDLHAPQSKNSETFIHSFKAAMNAIFRNFDIVHFHNAGPGFFIPLVKLFGARTVFTYHNVSYTHKKWGAFARFFLTMSERICLNNSDFVIFISDYLKNEMLSRYSISDWKVIPNGVTVNPMSEHTDYIDSLGLLKGKYIVSVGRYVEEKGFDYLINSFAKTDRKDYKLVIVGDADYQTDYSDRFRSFAKKNGVILTGFIKGEKLQQVYSNAGLFVMSSFSEGHPIALLEAMSYNIDVLASDIPANTQIGLEKEDYFRVGDENDLAEKMLMKIKEQRKRDFSDLLGERYNWQKISEDTLGVYNKLINKNKRKGTSGDVLK